MCVLAVVAGLGFAVIAGATAAETPIGPVASASILAGSQIPETDQMLCCGEFNAKKAVDGGTTPTPTPSASPSATATPSDSPSVSPGGSPGTTATGTASAAPTSSNPAVAIVTAAQGGPLVVKGSGFAPNEQVSSVIRSTPVEMGTIKADAKDNVNVSWTVPVGFAVGGRTVTLTGQTSKNSMAVPVVITAMETATTMPGEGELSNTGAGGLALAMTLGLLIVAAGVFLVMRNGKRHMPKRA